LSRFGFGSGQGTCPQSEFEDLLLPRQRRIQPTVLRSRVIAQLLIH
jgi:hypothetical protein